MAGKAVVVRSKKNIRTRRFIRLRYPRNHWRRLTRHRRICYGSRINRRFSNGLFTIALPEHAACVAVGRKRFSRGTMVAAPAPTLGFVCLSPYSIFLGGFGSQSGFRRSFGGGKFFWLQSVSFCRLKHMRKRQHCGVLFRTNQTASPFPERMSLYSTWRGTYSEQRRTTTASTRSVESYRAHTWLSFPSWALPATWTHCGSLEMKSIHTMSSWLRIRKSLAS